MAKTGIKCKLYLNTATYGSPTWTEINFISDLSVNAVWDEVDGSVRGSRVKASAKSLLGLELAGKIRASDSDANYTTIIEAMLSDGALDLMVLNGAKDANGTRGYRADFNVFGASEDQSMGVVVFNDITLKPSISTHLPHAVVVTAGAPVFSDIAA